MTSDGEAAAYEIGTAEAAPVPLTGLAWRSAALVIIGAIIGRALGVGREAVFAHRYGASSNTDAYMVAVLIPLLVQNVVAGGTLQAAFVPVVADEASRSGRAAANQVVHDLIWLTVVGLGVVTILVAVLARPIVTVTAGGFSPEATALAARILRISALLIVFNGFTAVSLGALNTFGDFTTTAWLSPVLNVVQIVGIIALAPFIGIYGAVVALLAGTVAQCAMQFPALRRHGVRFGRPRLDFSLWRRLLPAFVPAAIASLIAQGNPLVDKVIGSFLSAGNITHLGYADLFAGSVAIVTTSIALVAFPAMSTAMADGDDARALHVLRQSVHVNLLAAVPMSAVLGVFAPDVVRVVYGWGRLGPADLEQVARCVAAYSIGIPFVGLFYLLLRACYSLKRAGAASVLSLMYFTIHALVGVALAPRYGAAGLAFATSAGAILTGLGGWFLLKSHLLGAAGRDAGQYLWLLVLISVVSLLIPLLLLRPWFGAPVSTIESVWRLPIAVLLFLGVLVPLVRRASPDSRDLLSRAWQRVGAHLGMT